MPKYMIICRACNTVHGYTDTPESGSGSKCSTCNMERIAVEPVPEEVHTQKSFDVFISNKEGGVSKHNGFVMNVDEMKGKTKEEIGQLFVDKAATTLGEIVANPEAVHELLEGGSKQ